MAQEPDGGRERVDWRELAPAVRRVGAGSDDGDWEDLAPAVQRADAAASDDPDAETGGDSPTAAVRELTDDEPESALREVTERTPKSAVRKVTDDAPEPAVRRVADDAPEPAVRRVAGDSSGDAAGDRPADAGSAGALSRVDRDGWRDLTPAVQRVESDDGDDWAWSTGEYASASGAPDGQASAADPDLLPESDHQADESAAGESLDPRENSVIDADEAPTPPDDGLGMDAPESDVEQPLAVHVEEMVRRLAVVIAVAGLVSVVVFPVTESLISTIWNYVLPGGEAVDPRVYHPLELIITQLKVASLAGLVIALPVFVYQSYAFMRPGLYKNERRYYLAAVPTSLVLAVLGVLFAYLLVLPYTMDYFQGYTEGTADVAFALGTTFNLILMVMGYLAVVFQIPLFIMLAIMLGVTTRQWLEDRRLLFWAAFAGISFTFGAIDPTGIVPILVALTMIALFEGTLALLRWTGN